MTGSTDWTDKIRKLLLKAEAEGTTLEERETLQEKVADLMAKYKITAAHLAVTDPERAKEDPIVYVVGTPIGVGAKTYSKEWVRLGIEVAHAFKLVGLLQPTRQPGLVDLGVAGHKSDVERALFLWDSLQRQAGFALAAHIASIDVWGQFTGMEKYKERRSFIVGFADGVGHRLHQVYRRAVETSETPGTDLVLRDRSTQVTDWVGRNMSVGKSRGRRSYGWGGMDAGAEAARTADIGQANLSDHAPAKPALGG